MVKITFIIAQASLETVPSEIANHASVLNDARRKGLKPNELLLDRSVHHRAMLKLKDNERRGRPDIVYHVLLDITSSPIYRSGYVSLFIHTIQDYVLEISEKIRPPRSYSRFEYLMVQLFKEGTVGDGLIKLRSSGFPELINQIGTDRVIGFSRLGTFEKIESIVNLITKYERPALVIGGFPVGHFDKSIIGCLNDVFSISKFPLDTSTTVNRLLCGLEESNFFFSRMYGV
ncbi:MAG: hypothetical protein QXE12_03965 [Conexivisphaerales archaeon]